MSEEYQEAEADGVNELTDFCVVGIREDHEAGGARGLWPVVRDHNGSIICGCPLLWASRVVSIIETMAMAAFSLAFR